MYSLEPLFLILLGMSSLIMPITAYILPFPFHDSLASYNVEPKGYFGDSEAYEEHHFPVILPDLSDERDDGGRILTFKYCWYDIYRNTSSVEIAFQPIYSFDLRFKCICLAESVDRRRARTNWKGTKNLSCSEDFLGRYEGEWKWIDIRDARNIYW